MQKIGLIGCGNISSAYLNNNTVFPHMRIVKCADMRPEAAEAAAANFGLEAVSTEALLKDPEIDIILNLTTPESHAAIDLLALENGKHIYSEKPFAVSKEDGKKILELAKAKGLRCGCAPDTFLGGGHQTCRKIIDSGLLGKITGGCVIMACPGHESWHPAPGFYYKKGGGPLMDMAPITLPLWSTCSGRSSGSLHSATALPICVRGSRSTMARPSLWKSIPISRQSWNSAAVL